jgi:large subunit ribosomal protein L9
MAVEILLMTDVPNLGTEGSVVRVAEGYARNYLIPKKLGAPVTAATRRQVAKIQHMREVTNQADKEKALTLAAEMGKGSYTIPVKVGTEEKLFGSVTTGDIVKVLQSQGFEVDKHEVTLEAPIKELGVYDVKIKLHPEVEAAIKVWIVEE